MAAESEDALAGLRLIFGENVLALPPPLLERLLNTAPWTYAWLSWLSRSVRCLEPTEGFCRLRELQRICALPCRCHADFFILHGRLTDDQKSSGEH